jgi:hypothetical protein
MVIFDETKECFIVKIDTYRSGKRFRFRETLPRGITEDEALRYEEKVLGPAPKIDPYEKLRKMLEASKEEPLQVGHIYAICNMQDTRVIKIGKTVRPVASRIRELQTATIERWEIVECVTVTHMDAAEKAIHGFLDKVRINPRREFFEVLPAHAQRVVRIAGEILKVDF